MASWDIYQSRREEFVIQLLVETHGLVLEIIVVGILTVALTRAADRKRMIEGSLMKIADMKKVESEYARLKVLEHLKILARYKVDGFDLRDANLSSRNLKSMNLKNSDLIGLNASNTEMAEANLSNSKLFKAIFSNSDLEGARIEACYAKDCDFAHANLTKASFDKSELLGSNFSYAKLSYTSFKGANFTNVDFKHASLIECDFTDATNLTAGQLVMADVLKNCKMSADLELRYKALTAVKPSVAKVIDEEKEQLATKI